MHLYNMEPRSWRGDDVAVRLGLRQLDGLLLLQHQEAVKLGRSLFLVVVSAQLEQADGLGSGFSHHALLKHRRIWGNLFRTSNIVNIWSKYKPEDREASAEFSCSTVAPLDPGLLVLPHPVD